MAASDVDSSALLLLAETVLQQVDTRVEQPRKRKSGGGTCKRRSSDRPPTGRPTGRPRKGESVYDAVPKHELYTDLLRFHLDERCDVLGRTKQVGRRCPVLPDGWCVERLPSRLQEMAMDKYGVSSQGLNMKVRAWLYTMVKGRLRDTSLIVKEIAPCCFRLGSVTLDKARLKRERILTWEALEATYL